jgi:hypothetical protein
LVLDLLAVIPAADLATNLQEIVDIFELLWRITTMKFTDTEATLPLSMDECASVVGGGFLGDLGQAVGGGIAVGLTELSIGIPGRFMYKVGTKVGSPRLKALGKAGHMGARKVGKFTGLYEKRYDDASLKDWP